MVLEEHAVEDRVSHLHVDQEVVMLVGVSLHALVPLLELRVLLPKLFRRVHNFYFYIGSLMLRPRRKFLISRFTRVKPHIIVKLTCKYMLCALPAFVLSVADNLGLESVLAALVTILTSLVELW